MTIPQRLREIADSLPNIADCDAPQMELRAIAADLEAPAADAVPVVAHATDDGEETRVVPERTMETGRRSGGASAFAMVAYTEPLIRQRDHIATVAALQARIATLEEHERLSAIAQANALEAVAVLGARVEELQAQRVLMKPTDAMVVAGAKAAREYYELFGGNSPTVVYEAMVAAAISKPICGDSPVGP